MDTILNLLFLYGLPYPIIYILSHSTCSWKIFNKAGITWWKALIPIYNRLYLCKISKISPYWTILSPLYYIFVIIIYLIFIDATIPFWIDFFAILIGISFYSFPILFFAFFYLNIKLAKAFGENTIFGLGITIFPFIFLPILAFGKAQYKYNQKYDSRKTEYFVNLH